MISLISITASTKNKSLVKKSHFLEQFLKTQL